jgi:hypothetical protein
MYAQPFEERTVFKVSTPVQVEEVRLAPDFRMSANRGLGWADEPQPDVSADGQNQPGRVE